MRITKLIMVETGTYNDMVVRPYQSHLDERGVSLYQEATEGGRNFAPEALSGIAGNILRPNSQVAGQAKIANGWDMPRYRFLIEAEAPLGQGAELVHIITGYTDYNGVNPQTGSIDPRLRLFFNNEIVVRTTQIRTPTGRQSRQAVSEAAQIIPTADASQTGAFPGEMPNLLRPKDLVNSMSTSILGDEDVVDLRTVPCMGPTSSRRDNANSSVYMSRTLKALESAYGPEMDDPGRSMEDIYDSAKGSLQEPSLNHNQFFEILLQMTDYQQSGSVAWSDFCRVFPDADPVSVFITRGEAMRQWRHDENPAAFTPERGQSEAWVGSTPETIAATILSHAIPSIMMDLMITQVAFVATNETVEGKFVVELREANSFSKNLEMGPYLQRFLDRVEWEVLRDVSNNNQMGINLQMRCDLLGDSVMTISMNGGPDIDYVVPSFSDALIAPVVGGSRDVLNNLAHDMETLYSNGATVHATQQQATMFDYNSGGPADHFGGGAGFDTGGGFTPGGEGII